MVEIATIERIRAIIIANESLLKNTFLLFFTMENNRLKKPMDNIM